MVGCFKRMDGYIIATFAYLKADSNARLTPQEFLSDVFGAGVMSNQITSIINPKNSQEVYHYGKVKCKNLVYSCTALCLRKDNTETLVMVYSTRSERINREKAFKLFPEILDSRTVQVLRSAVHLELSTLPKEKIDCLKRVAIATNLKGTQKDLVKKDNIEKYILSHH